MWFDDRRRGLGRGLVLAYPRHGRRAGRTSAGQRRNLFVLGGPSGRQRSSRKPCRHRSLVVQPGGHGTLDNEKRWTAATSDTPYELPAFLATGHLIVRPAAPPLVLRDDRHHPALGHEGLAVGRVSRRTRGGRSPRSQPRRPAAGGRTGGRHGPNPRPRHRQGVANADWRTADRSTGWLAFHPSGRLLYTGMEWRGYTASTAASRINAWDLDAPQGVRSIAVVPRTSMANLNCLLPSGRPARGVGSVQRGLTLWDAATGRVDQAIAGPRGIVYHVAVSPDGRLAATATGGGTWVWDLGTGRMRCQVPLPPGTTRPNKVSFSSDGSRLAVAYARRARGVRHP